MTEIVQGVIKGATVPAIVEYLIKENSDIENLDHFFAAFPQFMDAQTVWDNWNSLMKINAEELKHEVLPPYIFTTSTHMLVSGVITPVEQKPKNLKEKTLNFLWAWVERSFYRDFLQTKQRREILFVSLVTFLNYLQVEAANRFKLLMLKTAFERKRKTRQIKLRSGSGSGPVRTSSSSSLNTSPSASPPATLQAASGANIALMMKELNSTGPGSPSSGKAVEKKIVLEPGKFEFNDLEPIEVAYQLTVIEFEIFRNIQESELYNLGWKTDNPNRLRISPNVVKLVERFNAVSFWVATEIVMVQTLRERTQVLRKFIAVAEHLRELNNFNGVMEVIGGINMWAISRLKNTWEQIPKPAIVILEDLNIFMSTQQNYKNYRAALKATRGPVLPYLGIYLRDLTFIAENENTYGEKEKCMFNFEKLKMIGSVITELKRFQLSDFVFEKNEVLQDYLTKLLVLPEEMLIKHSQLCESQTRDSQ